METGAVLYDPRSKKFLLLNQSAAFLWGQLDAPVTEVDLAERLCSAYASVDRESLQKDVEKAIQEMRELDLVVSDEGIPATG